MKYTITSVAKVLQDDRKIWIATLTGEIQLRYSQGRRWRNRRDRKLYESKLRLPGKL